MQNRVPRYPGRVQLVPVAGQTNIYDMTMADQPTVEGTPLNKQTFLTDAVASAIGGLGSNPTVSDALNRLRTLLNSKQNTLTFDSTPRAGSSNPVTSNGIYNAIASGAKIQTGSYVGTGTYGQANPCTLTFDFVPQLWGIFGYAYDQQYGQDTYNQFISRFNLIPWGRTYALLAYNFSNDGTLNVFDYSGNTVNWYISPKINYPNAREQLNNAGYTYYYWAIA